MDVKRFDDLIRLIGKGASRRAVLKAMLGVAIGGGATRRTIATDARTLNTRPTISPPPPQTT